MIVKQNYFAKPNFEPFIDLIFVPFCLHSAVQFASSTKRKTPILAYPCNWNHCIFSSLINKLMLIINEAVLLASDQDTINDS